MAYEIHASDALPRALAAVHETIARSEIPARIQGLLGEVWTLLRANSVISTGRNVAIYTAVKDGAAVSGADGAAGLRADAPGGRVIDAWFGVEVHETIPPSDRVVATATPAGPFASTVHWGEYARLGEAHDAVQAWCRANGRRMTGTCWEVYGPWNDDWAKVRTNVYYQLEM